MARESIWFYVLCMLRLMMLLTPATLLCVCARVLFSVFIYFASINRTSFDPVFGVHLRIDTAAPTQLSIASVFVSVHFLFCAKNLRKLFLFFLPRNGAFDASFACESNGILNALLSVRSTEIEIQ